MGGFITLRLMLLERDRELGLMADLLAGVDSAGGKVVFRNLNLSPGSGHPDDRNVVRLIKFIDYERAVSDSDQEGPGPTAPSTWNTIFHCRSGADAVKRNHPKKQVTGADDRITRAPHANSEWSSIRGAYIRDLNGCRHIPADSGNNRSKRFKIRERTILEGLIHSREGPVWVLNGDLYRCP
jgi:hypothetical protein